MSMEPISQNGNLQDLKDPVLITTFSSQLKGGQTAPSAIGYALEQWDAKLATEIDADDCYINARMRPWVRRDGDKTVLDWPQNVVYRVDGEDRSFLILVGVEPSLNWRSFVARIGEFASQHQVALAVNLKSVPATVPHTLQAPLKAIYSDASMADRFGIESLEDQEGPADIGRVLNLHLAEHGIPTIDVYAMEPFYAAAIPDAEAMLSLLHSLQDVFGLEVDTGRMEQAALAQRQAIDAAVAGSEQLREAVVALEQRAGGNHALLQAPDAPVRELDAGEVLDEAESFLRSLRNEGPDEGQ